MADAMQAGRVLPSPRIPKVLGILNIVFAAGLLMVGLCVGMYAAMLPMLSKAMVQMQKQAESKAEKSRQADLKAIDEAEKAAQTESEKQDLEARRQAIANRPKGASPMAGMDFGKLYGSPGLSLFLWIEAVSGILVNVALLISGIGLVRRKLWGISLGIGTAIAKIARLVLVYAYFALGVVPGVAQAQGQVFAEMMIQQQQAMGQPAPPGIDANFMVRTYYITYTVYSVAMILFGAIYPAVSLWLLTRPGARAACDESAPPELELNESW